MQAEFCVKVDFQREGRAKEVPNSALGGLLMKALKGLGPALTAKTGRVQPGSKDLAAYLLSWYRSKQATASQRMLDSGPLSLGLTRARLAARLGARKADTLTAWARKLEAVGVLEVESHSLPGLGYMKSGLTLRLKLDALLCLTGEPIPEVRVSKAFKAAPRPTKTLNPNPELVTAVSDELARVGMATPKGYQDRLASLLERLKVPAVAVSAAWKALNAEGGLSRVQNLPGLLYSRIAGTTYHGKAWLDQVLENQAKEQAKKQQVQQQVQQVQQQQDQASRAQASQWAGFMAWWHGLTQEDQESHLEAARRLPLGRMAGFDALLGLVAAQRGLEV